MGVLRHGSYEGDVAVVDRVCGVCVRASDGRWAVGNVMSPETMMTTRVAAYLCLCVRHLHANVLELQRYSTTLC